MGGSSSGTTILETPPYVIALVFTFFLVVTLGFEKILHLVRHALAKRNKHGLLAAMGHMQNELMCLGVATLILLTFQSEIVSYCVNAKNYTATWLDHVSGCSCCLTRTVGVSACYLSAKGCVGNTTLSGCCNTKTEAKVGPKVCANIFDPNTDWDTTREESLYSVDLATGGTEIANRRRLLGGGSSSSGPSEKVQCYGRVQTDWPECGYRPYYRPAIGANALHQIHMFIFIIAVTHIILGILLIVIAGLRLKVWQRWKEGDDEYVILAQKAADEFALAYESADGASKLESQGEDETSKLARSSSHGGSLHPASLPETIEVPYAYNWRGRPSHLKGFSAMLKETFICAMRPFNPVTLKKEEFSLMRASFTLTHAIKSDSTFSFVGYLTKVMESDFSNIVGLGLPMWAFIIIFVLLSSKIGWCIWVFVIVSGALLTLVNYKLIWVVRYVTRGGNIHLLKNGVFWANRPGLLLPIIKFLLFFVSYVYANAIFFATQFGTKSCFFSRAGFQGQPVPWWIIMLINTFFLFSLSLFTLPLYSVTVQMGGEYKAAFMPDDIAVLAARARDVKGDRQQGFRALITNMLHKSSPKDDGKTHVLADHQLSDSKAV